MAEADNTRPWSEIREIKLFSEVEYDGTDTHIAVSVAAEGDVWSKRYLLFTRRNDWVRYADADTPHREAAEVIGMLLEHLLELGWPLMSGRGLTFGVWPAVHPDEWEDYPAAGDPPFRSPTSPELKVGDRVKTIYGGRGVVVREPSNDLPGYEVQLDGRERPHGFVREALIPTSGEAEEGA